MTNDVTQEVRWYHVDRVTLPGDINGDHFVNAKDAVALGKAFSSQQGQPNYNPNADLNNDDFINAKDAVILGKYFGQSWQ